MFKRSFEFDKNVEKAITFLVTNVNLSGNYPKPVITHSTRVGINLYKHGYSEQVVIAGFLHDLLEDTKATEKQIEEHFGRQVLDLVKANSFDSKIKDKLEQSLDTFKKCKKYGKDALIIKTADILDNLPYYDFKNNDYPIKKINAFIQLADPILLDDKIYTELKSEFSKSLQ